jgi:hypothetical protein
MSFTRIALETEETHMSTGVKFYWPASKNFTHSCIRKVGLHLVTMNETSILHLAGGKVTLQVRRAENQSKKPANGQTT